MARVATGTVTASTPVPGARRVSAYTVCGALGTAAATAVAAWVLGLRGAPPLLAVGLLAAGLVAAAAVAVAAQALLHRHTLVAVHELAAVGVAAAGVAAVARVPVADVLDAVVTGCVALLAVGRLGCLRVGCCYGTPARHGVRYGVDRVRDGFPAHLCGVPLVPVQALESAAAGAVAVGGVVGVLGGAASGTVAAGATVAYVSARFVLELWRGDSPRAGAAGLTHAQWSACGAALAVACVAAVGGGGRAWHAWCAAGLVLGAAHLVARRRRAGASGRLLDAAHRHELVRAVRQAFGPADGGPVQVVRTSLGVCVSGGAGATGGRSWAHATVSFPWPVDPARAAATARLVRAVRDPSSRLTLLARGPDRVQVVLTPQEPRTATGAARVVRRRSVLPGTGSGRVPGSVGVSGGTGRTTSP
ncbi:prolipoprotein diacylglyceryl transferase [Cellulomonas sp. NS3]|uniref:prolipoprotein diacylglyceryl transferase n=1 Tax=Cellulomonas sp. NS3 TaxID=2973977 RepID=UPI0021636EF2|nr:prolipoprotein diacylglyceryl transferase [Cellulomonas sp. NS3]